jgi:N,N-dimethylformamidase beta subunit-like protein
MITRRRLLYGMAATPLALRALEIDALAAPGNTGNNPTYLENQNPGTLNWQIGLPGYSRSDDGSLQIKGYASAVSINRGEKITFYVTVNPVPATYNIDVYRIGWYGGNGAQLKLHVGGLAGVSQPPPTYDSATGLIACPWTASYVLDTSQPTLDATGWTSGVYLALLTNSKNYQTYIIFVIREDARTADILYQQSVTTYQAYNNYPDDNKTGKSLYDGGSYGSKISLGTQRAVKVSFDRPYTYTDHTGAGELLHYDIYFIRWMERNGYDVCYSTDIDTHTNGARLLNFKAFLAVGHDEYWSRQMYDNVYAARDGGTSLGFFVANPVYWQIRFEPSTLNGAPNRVIACYKDAKLDPYNNPSNPLYNPALATVTWRDSLLNRPEQQLVGVMYSSYINADNPALTYVVQNSQTASGQLVYGGTGLADQSTVAGVLGYEFDKQFPDFNNPVTNTDPASKTTVVPGTYTLLSNSPYTDTYRNADHANSSIYQVTSGAWVFAAGSMYWNWGLDSYTPPSGIITYAVAAPSAALQAATANILNLLISGGSPNPLAAPTNLAGTATTSSINLSWQDSDSGVQFTVQRSPDGVNWTTLVSNLASTSYFDNSVGSWYYRVQATDSGGHTSPFSNSLQIATVPTAPSNLTATPSSTSLAVNLAWIDTASTETAYSVERSTDGSNFTVLASSLPANTQSYSDTSVAPTQLYYYQVRAANASGASAYSNVANATSPAGPPPPAAPSGLNAVLTGGGNGQKANLSWKNNANNATNNVVERSTDQASWTRLTSNLGPTATSYTDASGLKRSTKYFYRVGAVNSSNPSSPSFSNVASVTTK